MVYRRDPSIADINEKTLEMSTNIVVGPNDNSEPWRILSSSVTIASSAGLVASVSKPNPESRPERSNGHYKPLSTYYDRGDVDDPRPDFPLYSIPDRLSADSYVDEDQLQQVNTSTSTPPCT